MRAEGNKKKKKKKSKIGFEAKPLLLFVIISLQRKEICGKKFFLFDE